MSLPWIVKKENPNSTIRQSIRLRETRPESAKAYSMAVMRLAPAPLLWVPWLSGKNIRLVIGPGFDSQLYLCGFSFSPKLTSTTRLILRDSPGLTFSTNSCEAKSCTQYCNSITCELPQG